MAVLSPSSEVRIGSLAGLQPLPLLVEPVTAGVDLLAFARSHKEWLDGTLLTHGGILLRGFPVLEIGQFEELIRATSGDLLEYKERSSPRSKVEGNIYTSTDHPPHQRIFFHNENSYAHAWPLKIYFYGHTPAERGGETPIADIRNVTRRIAPEIRERFREKGVLYVRNFGDGVGLSWETVFQTSDRAQVEEYCRQTGYEFEWKANGGLRVKRQGPALVSHPRTGEELFFNHATFFHVTTLEQRVRDALLTVFKPEDLPNNTYYGDGSPIEADVMEHLRAAYEAESVKFPWQKGDVLMLDNMLVAHARETFSGPRKTLVGMSEVVTRAELGLR